LLFTELQTIFEAAVARSKKQKTSYWLFQFRAQHHHMAMAINCAMTDGTSFVWNAKHTRIAVHRRRRRSR